MTALATEQPPSLGAPSRAFGIAEACCDRWADGSGRLAMIHVRADGSTEHVTFDALRSISTRLAEVLRMQGVGARDRIAILLGQGPEALIALIAAHRIGAIAVPLGQSLRQAALAFRLRDCGASVLVTDDAGLAEVEGMRPALPALRLVVGTGMPAPGVVSLWEAAQGASDTAQTCRGAAGDPAVILYRTDPTGHARGVLHAHRAILTQAAAVAVLHESLPQPGDLLWTEADWAGGGLLDAVLPALCHGVPVLAHQMAAFDPDRAVAVMLRARVRNAVLSPAALRTMHEAGIGPAHGLALRSLVTEAGALGQDMLDWAAEAFGAPVNLSLARPECGTVLCTASSLAPARPGLLGRPAPGREVAILDASGAELPPGTQGHIAVRRPDPGLFLAYWQDPEATLATERGPWVLTGACGSMDEQGGVSAAPPPAADATQGEVETFLLAHPAVARAAVVGSPDAPFGPEATAIVVPRQGAMPGPDLAAELRGFLRARLSRGMCPRRVAFAHDLPPPRAGMAGGGLGEAVGMGGSAAEG